MTSYELARQRSKGHTTIVKTSKQPTHHVYAVHVLTLDVTLHWRNRRAQRRVLNRQQ